MYIKNLILYSALSLQTSLFSYPIEDWLQTIQYHELVNDFASACATANSALMEYPDEKALYRQRIMSYASAGLESDALKEWQLYLKHFGEDWADTQLLEKLAWCVLQQGITNPAPLTRLVALSGACATRDMKAYPHLEKAFRDPCAVIRCAACQAAAQLRRNEFAPLLLSLAEFDQSSPVRIGALEALANLKESKTKSLILRKIAQGDISYEERISMAKVLAILEEKSPLKCFQLLINSKDSSFRCLAVEYAIYTRLPESYTPIIALLDDPQIELQVASLHALAILWPAWPCTPETVQKIRQKAQSTDDTVAVSASWILSLCSSKEGLGQLETFLHHPNPQIRYLAVAAICASGSKAIPLLKYILKTNAELNIKLNAAMGLVRLRTNIPEACTIIERSLRNEDERFGQKKWGALKAIVDGRTEKNELLSPDLMDLATRLEVINLLAIVKAPCVPNLLTRFIQSRVWGASGIASMLLLTEGDDSAIEIVEEILQQARTPYLRLQAALVLAMWGKNAAAIEPLLQAYPGAGKETKERIIAALAAIGEQESIPFLANTLLEPGPSLRVQAASALLQVIYR